MSFDYAERHGDLSALYPKPFLPRESLPQYDDESCFRDAERNLSYFIEPFVLNYRFRSLEVGCGRGALSTLFFTENVVRHFQRNVDSTVELLLITNDDTSAPVRDLVRLLEQHPATRVHHAAGCRDRPIGQSIDNALKHDTGLREQLLFTHIDLFYEERGFWKCDALRNGAQIVSGRFVQEPLRLDGSGEAIPRPADDHILVNTAFYQKHGLVFRAYARAQDAFEDEPWMPDVLPRFRRSNGEAIGPEYPLDPFNVSHLKLALAHGSAGTPYWHYHFPKQVHFNSILRAMHFGVKRVAKDCKEWIMVPLSSRTANGGYHWRTLIRYAIVSSNFFNPRADVVIPFQAVWREDSEQTESELEKMQGDLNFLEDVAGPLPYRTIGHRDTCNVRIGWWDDRE